MSKYKPYYPKKKKQEMGFFSALFHCAIVCFVILCFAIVVTHSDDVPRQQTQQIAEIPAQNDIREIQQEIHKEVMAEGESIKKVDEKEMICLAKNIFFEARGTDEVERIRIINVTTNRVNSGYFPSTYCKVVYDPSQFSWTLNLVKHNVLKIIKQHTTERGAWEHAKEMSYYELAYGYKDFTKGALYYHTHDVNPSWSHDRNKVALLDSDYHRYYGLTR